MVKQNITLTVDSDIYKNFKLECIKKGVTYSEQIEKFLEGYANNQKITDFNSFQESTNPIMDQPLDSIKDFVRNLTPHRAQELFYKCQEWHGLLMKK